MADVYLHQGGVETVQSFLGTSFISQHSLEYTRDILLKKFPKEISFLKEMVPYFEWNNFLMVHAGVNLLLSDWKKTNARDFRWIRQEFVANSNETGKTIVFGHTPTALLNPDGCSNIWMSKCKSKIGIDGGAVYGGKLHGVALTNDGIKEVHSVAKADESLL